MKTTYMLALATLAVLALVGAAYADYGDYNYGYNNYSSAPGFASATSCCPSCAAGTGAGPACAWPNSPATPRPDLCNVVPTGTCGAFCSGGQQAPGWPYNWCSEYWLRPNSNY